MMENGNYCLGFGGLGRIYQLGPPMLKPYMLQRKCLVEFTGLLLRNLNQFTIMGIYSKSYGFPNIVTQNPKPYMIPVNL